MSSDLGSSGDFLLQDGNNDTVAVLHLESPMDRMTRLGWEWFLYFWSLVSPYITTPVLVLFIFPLVICVGIYMSALLMYIVRLDLVSLFRRLRTVVLEERDLLKAGREMVSTIWDAHVSYENRIGLIHSW